MSGQRRIPIMGLATKPYLIARAGGVMSGGTRIAGLWSDASDVTVPLIEPSLGLVDLINMLTSPLAKRDDGRAERLSQSGE